MFKFKKTQEGLQKTKEELAAKLDVIRKELGTYINLDAVQSHKLLSVERTFIAIDEDKQTKTERTLATFIDAEGTCAEYEFVCSREEHRELVRKLKNL